jgi:glycosyltransferase involved in cell wall biosynthesis
VSSTLVSVVTPFHNAAPHLAQCIESVLAQSFTSFEYILVDNCSTDGSGEIATAFALRDPRIRLIRRSQLLSQVQNYNGALTEISESSQYCKFVQADDAIFPDCLRLMVKAFEQSGKIGLVSSYELKGNTVRGSGFPFPTTYLPGKEMARLYLRTGLFVFGSPTTVMYRSSVICKNTPFFDEGLLHEDTEKCVQILRDWDFGFVHQVLSFLRTDNQSISSAFRSFQPEVLDGYIIVNRYASEFFDPAEAAALKKKYRQWYYRVLSQEALRLREPEFWKYHREGLKTVGESLDSYSIAMGICRELFWMAANPGTSAVRAARFCRRKMNNSSASAS